MSGAFTIVFVCDRPEACSNFRDHLLDAGLQVVAAQEAASAIRQSPRGPVNGILICYDDVELGNSIGHAFRLMFPTTPIVLISTGFPTTPPWVGLDAVCFANMLDVEMARVTSTLFRDVLCHGPEERAGGNRELLN